ncbi:hypothetical protein T4C_5846 [Trichinella pseudospiralis]|uniref:Uncharacterized protein n=1 Tax=Trichinella pseudospiralis TaxID=6337 RepID=A0A0V1IPA3_TRIPS|nr:hypothetical protein T4C_5846 [Trichinella pseudospiralis]
MGLHHGTCSLVCGYYERPLRSVKTALKARLGQCFAFADELRTRRATGVGPEPEPLPHRSVLCAIF